eukprot:scaffold17744_cov101-Isochrysis_galbana.AAC.1
MHAHGSLSPFTCTTRVRWLWAGARVGGQNPTEDGHTHGPLPRVPQVAGRRLPSPQADWQAADCIGLAPVHVQRPATKPLPATAWLRLSVSSCALDAVNSPAGYLPCWAEKKKTLLLGSHGAPAR